MTDRLITANARTVSGAEFLDHVSAAFAPAEDSGAARLARAQCEIGASFMRIKRELDAEQIVEVEHDTDPETGNPRIAA